MPKLLRILVPLLLTIIFALYQYFSASTYINPETGKAVRVAMSPEQESRLGLQSYQEILAHSQPISRGPEYEMVIKVTSKLVKSVDATSKDFSWEVSLLNDPQVNAFCLPGGKIAVFTGILPITQGEDGLATVLGHEIAHATARHGAQRLLTQQLAHTALMGAQISFSDMDRSQKQAVLGILGAGVHYGVLLPYGRKHELEADAMGLSYMARAGFNPAASIGFWTRMASTSQGAPSEFLSTHPAHVSRIARLKELLPEAIKEYQRTL
jgi:metalloendopeptidase OMA1, mitochondrial